MWLVTDVQEVSPPQSRATWPANMKRVRQVVVKKLPYVQLYTQVVLDVLEKGEPQGEEGRREIQFRHHSSNFDTLQVGPCFRASCRTSVWLTSCTLSYSCATLAWTACAFHMLIRVLRH